MSEQTSMQTWIDELEQILDELESKREKRNCECGAKHTSNPKHHLSYCPLAKKG
jgi:hypothetical protein